MSAVKHTPTPWLLDEGEEYVHIIQGPEGDEGGSFIEILPDDCHVITNFEKVRANAAFIVRACNAHDELVEAIRKLDCPRPCNGRPDDFLIGECFDAGECGCLAGPALAKVEGEPMTRADTRKAVHVVGVSLVAWILLGIIAQAPTDHLIDTKCLVPFEPTKFEWLVTWPFDLAWAERALHAC